MHSRTKEPAPGEPLQVEGVELPLSTRLDGDVGRGPLLVLGHGAGAGIDHPTMKSLSAAFVAAGLTVLRYQFPFMERQGGKGFGRDAPAIACATVRAACARGVELAGGRPVLAGGHSYGGRMTTLTASAKPIAGVDGIVCLSFPLHAAKKPSSERAEHLASVEAPLLFVSGARDALADGPLLEEVVAALPAARLERIGGADHGWKAPRRCWPEGPFHEIAARVARWAPRA